MKKKNSTLVNIIIYAAIALVLIIGIGLVIGLTGGEDVQSFYVTINDKTIYNSDVDYVLTKDEYMEVNMFFMTDEKDNGDYTVRIVPSVVEDCDFDFTCEGIVYSFQQSTDLTAGFNIQRKDSGFRIRPKGGLEEVLAAAYGAPIDELNASYYDNMFTMIISSADEKSNIYIQFSIYEPVESVTLDKEAILL